MSLRFIFRNMYIKEMEILPVFSFFFFLPSVPSYAEHHPAAVYHCSHISNDGKKQIIACELGIKSVKFHLKHQQEKGRASARLGCKSFTTRPLAVWQRFYECYLDIYVFFLSSHIRASLAWDGVWESSGATAGRGGIVLPVVSLTYDVWAHP